MRCVTVDSNGFVVDVVPQPADVSACVLVVAAPAEVGSSPFSLSVDDGTAIGAAIALLWGAAYGLRVLRKSLEVG